MDEGFCDRRVSGIDRREAKTVIGADRLGRAFLSGIVLPFLIRRQYLFFEIRLCRVCGGKELL